MLINSEKPKNRNNHLIWLVIAIVILLGIKVFLNGNGDSIKGFFEDKEKAKEAPTRLSSTLYTENLLTDTINRVYKKDRLSLYLNNEMGMPTLMAVYKDSISELERNGRFLAFLYLKDPTEWRSINKKYDHILLTKEKIEPSTKTINTTNYYIFKFGLEHPYFDIKNLKELEFVRHTRAFGRFEEVRINPDNLPQPYPITNGLETIDIALSQANYAKISDKRNEALVSGVLMTADDDFVAAEVSGGGKSNIKANIRLKGDWTDHLEHPNKWSYRIVPNGENTVYGMRKFSVQHPKSRNYIWEWLFNKVVKENDLVGLRYDFVNVNLRITDKDSIIPMGAMALEESFDKILIENNRRREGLILSFDESQIWNERKQMKDLNLDLTKDFDLPAIGELPIKLYNENKTLATPVLAKQFEIAKNLLLGLRDNKLQLSEAFDVDKLTFYIALSNLFGGHHGLHIENIKIYYNPVTNKLEPISFDSNSGYNITTLRGYPVGIADELFKEKLVEKYQLVSSQEFLNNLITKYSAELNTIALNLSGEFNEASVSFSVLEHNANLIKKKIFPSNTIIPTLISHNGEVMAVEVKNFSKFPVVINGLVLENRKMLNERNEKISISPNDTVLVKFRLKKSFNNAFVSKKNKEGGFRYPKDLSKIKLSHHLLGSTTQKYESIKAFSSTFNSTVITGNQLVPNVEKFHFIEIDKEGKKIHFKEGLYELSDLLFIPKGYTVHIPKGFELNLINGASLISHSALICEGTKEEPIRFTSNTNTAGGIFVSNAKERSIINHVYFTNLSVPKQQLWTLSGAVNFNDTFVTLKNSVFENNRSEDALNLIRSNFLMDSTQFINTYSDAFDGDFVTGEIHNSSFINSGNDGIDVSGSTIEVHNVTISNPSDKALSAGEGSTIRGANIQINDGEIGLVSKDLSKIDISGLSITNTRLALSCFQKKTEYGPGNINLKNVKFLENEVAYLIEPGSDLTIDGKAILDKTEGVIDKMYGSEYGKSSK